ncbi:DUF2283 domain-containing protein [Glaciihabitans arcticus]|uniref:DUF2283 domain-containing protein n=1 Tax=Glaciihabitans arcticus TaxID=2668039 RepID=A0A4Q9GM56_9MICO|nr:DUF2283 domain-containing protein [Glaciihabitans arcticus]TBN55519.1 DUF2283 domain-containing protein [Glaciihabitans arcticus]
MNIKYDARVDAAYIQLADEILSGGVDHTYLCDTTEIDAMINLDFDADGRLLGIEIMDASRVLPVEVLRQ